MPAVIPIAEQIPKLMIAIAEQLFLVSMIRRFATTQRLPGIRRHELLEDLPGQR